MNKKDLMQLDLLCFINMFRDLSATEQTLLADAHFAALDGAESHFEGLNCDEMSKKARKYDRYLELMRIYLDKR